MKWSARRVSWSFALLASALAMLALFLPPGLPRSEISWNPAAGDAGGSLQLTRSWPERFVVDGHTRSGTRGTALDAGGFRLEYVGSDLRVVDANGAVLLVAAVGAGGDPLSFVYDGVTGELHLDTTVASASARLASDRHLGVSRLSTPSGEGRGVEAVTILTRPTGVVQTPMRVVLLLLSAASLVVALVLSILADRDGRTARARGRRFAPVDGVVAAGLVVSTFLVPAFLDDGWVFERVRWFPVRGVLGSYFDWGDLWLPQGYWNEATLSLAVRTGLSFVGLRLLVAALLLATWFVLRRFVFEPLAAGSRRMSDLGHWPVAGAFLACAVPFLLTLRAEPVVAASLAVAFAGLIGFAARPTASSLALVLLAAVAGVTAHQSGWVLLGPTLMALWLTVGSLRTKALRWVDLGRSIALGGGLLLLVTAMPFDLATTRDAIAGFGSTGAHSGTFLEELHRIGYLLETSSPRIFAVLLVLPVIALVMLGLRSMDRRDRVVVAAALLSIAAISMTKSKWVWHLGVWTVPIVILLAIGLRSVVESTGNGDAPTTRLPTFAVGLPLLTWFAGMAIALSRSWGALETSTHPVAEFGRIVASGSTARLWAIALVIAAVIGWRLDLGIAKGRLRFTSGVLAVALVLPLVANLAWIAFDAVDSGGWTQVRSNIGSVAGRVPCGPLSGTPIVVDAEPLAIVAPASGPPLVAGAFPRVAGLGSGPFDGLGTWGTPTVATGTSDPAAAGETTSFGSPVFDVAGASRIAVWIAGGAPVMVQFHRGDGTKAAVPISATSVAPEWNLRRLDVPPGTTTVSLQVDVVAGATPAWAAASTPARFRDAPAETVLRGSSTFVGPFARTSFPCAELPDPTTGVWPRVDYAIEDGSSREYLPPVVPVTEFTETDVGCTSGPKVCVVSLDYAMADVRITVVE